MNLITRFLAAAALLIASSLAANAAPVLYDVDFDGSGAGGPGSGSFSYDADAKVMTGFTWDFGPGQTGGIEDSALLVEVFGRPLAQFLFEVMTGTGPAPGSSSTFNETLLGPFPATEANFCWGTLNSACEMTDGPTSTYRFVEGRETFRGVLTVAPTAIPEPSTLALIGGSLVALAFRRRHRRA